MDIELIIELLRTPGVSSEAYTLFIEHFQLNHHEEITEKIKAENGRYFLSEDDADEFLM